MRHKADRAFKTRFFRVCRDEGVIVDKSIVSEFRNLSVHNFGHLSAIPFCKKLAAGRTRAGREENVRAGHLLIGDKRLVPEYLFAAKRGDLFYPILDERAVRGRIQTDLKGMHLAVAEIAVSLGVIGKKMRDVAGSAADAPIIYPDLKSCRLGCLENISEHLVVPLPVGVREHVYYYVHIGARHFVHIRNSVGKHSVSVVRRTCFKLLHS